MHINKVCRFTSSKQLKIKNINSLSLSLSLWSHVCTTPIEDTDITHLYTSPPSCITATALPHRHAQRSPVKAANYKPSKRRPLLPPKLQATIVSTEARLQARLSYSLVCFPRIPDTSSGTDWVNQPGCVAAAGTRVDEGAVLGKHKGGGARRHTGSGVPRPSPRSTRKTDLNKKSISIPWSSSGRRQDDDTRVVATGLYPLTLGRAAATTLPSLTCHNTDTAL
ncbi:hypothetical protein E2C01_033053 [Portunus trituberculatus]|uniref:Uncharacterized protein n=1 Tax=Portunus trituberculatus TaxID=210409 RepID=A0A5B7F2E2_PORTR|nr:hypothetical protein [Portunus trituberculatus]